MASNYGYKINRMGGRGGGRGDLLATFWKTSLVLLAVTLNGINSLISNVK